MQQIIEVTLAGDPRRHRLSEEAYGELRRYLDHARARLTDEPDGSEVLADLERSISERLGALAGVADRVLDASEIRAVLTEIGPVEVGTGPTAEPAAPPPAMAPGSRRRLYRIHAGQQLAGVCTGLAAYADLDVGLVRTVFVLLAIFTGGLFLLIYVAMMFFLPAVASRDAWLEAMARADGA